jgi:enoyl-CoA hydratase
MGLQSTQMTATLFDGIARRTREGLNFKRRAAEEGRKRRRRSVTRGACDWTRYEPLAQ